MTIGWTLKSRATSGVEEGDEDVDVVDEDGVAVDRDGVTVDRYEVAVDNRGDDSIGLSGGVVVGGRETTVRRDGEVGGSTRILSESWK